ncbi:MAG: DEAD/DEAH box helicase [Bacteroidia bacterium]|nr:DEAD/DEAH box helicase [Bacteroidia bacterium]
MSFTDLNLNSSLLNALGDLGFDTPTAIQQHAFAPVMSGKDVVGIAQTGTGKTIAFLLPLLRNLKYSKQMTPRILILVPTRELVVQIIEALEQLTKYLSVQSVGVYGGTNINTQKLLVLVKHDIIVGTPGRTRDLILSGALRVKDIKHLVIDEVDEMLDLGFRVQLENLLDLLPEKRQNLMFSATMTPEVDKLLNVFFKDPLKVQVAASGTPLENIDQSFYKAPNFLSKTALLQHIMVDDDWKKALVFIDSKKMADQLYDRLEPDLGEKIGIIHSNKSQNYRLNRVRDFESGVHRILIATSIISRGIDISNITHVINFDIPENPEDYMHRIGRTGRAEAKGIAISFVSDKEKYSWDQIEKLMDVQVKEIQVTEDVIFTDELIEAEKPTVRFKPIGKERSIKTSQGAFHEKKAKNRKVNLAHERRLAYKEKRRKNRGRRGKKK